MDEIKHTSKAKGIIVVSILASIIIISILAMSGRLIVPLILSQKDEIEYVEVRNGDTGEQLVMKNEDLIELIALVPKSRKSKKFASGGYSYSIDFHYNNNNIRAVKQITFTHKDSEKLLLYLDKAFKDKEMQEQDKTKLEVIALRHIEGKAEWLADDTPLFTGKDILTYDWQSHRITFTDEFLSKKQFIMNEESMFIRGSTILGLYYPDQFSLRLDGRELYRGYVEPQGFISYSPDGPMIMNSEKGIRIECYDKEQDTRNNIQLKIFLEDTKLIEEDLEQIPEVDQVMNFMAFEELNSESQLLEQYVTNESFFYNQKLTEEISEHLAAHGIECAHDMIDSFDSNKILNKQIVNNTLLSRLIDLKWIDKDFNARLKENEVFRSYYVDKDNGIRAKIINEKVLNIVFDPTYSEDIIQDISFDSTKKDILLTLGSPNFIDAENSIIGYKNDDFYIFFRGQDFIEEISIYPNDNLEAKALENLIDKWLVNKKPDFYRLLDENLPGYDFSGDMSGVNFFGYESSGMMIKYQEPLNSLTFYLYGRASELIIKNENDLTNIQIKRYPDHDSIFDLERYRILINRKINGDRIDDKYSLGMGFENEMNDMPSPDGSKSIYNKLATADDNYACIYIIDKNNSLNNRELLTGPMGTQVAWFDNRYIICKGAELSYLYDWEEDKKILIPYRINDKLYKITNITDLGIDFILE